MADIEFGDLRDGGDGLDIFEGQAVARMGFDAILCRQRGGVRNTAQFGDLRVFDAMRIFAGVEFDDGRLSGGSPPLSGAGRVR